MSEPTRRLFFALWPDAELRRRIEAATRAAVLESHGRPIPPENFHITLAFLGAVPESRIGDLLRCVLAPASTFDVILGAVTMWKRQALLCLEPTGGHDELVEWVDGLRVALEKGGFESERRPFRGHVTLARDVQREIGVVQSKVPSTDALCWTVREMELVESTVGVSGSNYRIVTSEGRQK